MTDLREKGKSLDSDIRDLLKTKLSYDSFLNKWGKEVSAIVEDTFRPQMLVCLALNSEADGAERAKKKANELSNKIAMFCAAFI